MPVARLLCASLPQQRIESCNSCQQSKVFRFHTAYHDALVTLAVFCAEAATSTARLQYFAFTQLIMMRWCLSSKVSGALSTAFEKPEDRLIHTLVEPITASRLQDL